MNANPIRLVPNREVAEKSARRLALVQKFLADIRAKRTGENVEQGQGEIDNTPLANTIDVDEVLQRSSYRKTDQELEGSALLEVGEKD